VYVVAHQVPPGNVNSPWVAGDDQDDTARIAFQSALQVRVVQYTWHVGLPTLLLWFFIG